MNNIQVAARIKERCKYNKVSITSLLSQYGIYKSLIYDMEKRGKTPSAEILEQIANHLDVSVDYLLGRTDRPEVNR